MGTCWAMVWGRHGLQYRVDLPFPETGADPMRLSGILLTLVALTLTTPLSVTADDAAGPKTITVFNDATLTVPVAFKPAEPKSRIIEHEFAAKGEGEETARVTMMASGGGVEPNIARWKGQFAGGKADDQKTEQLKLGDWVAHIVDVNGSYKETMGGPFSGGKTVEHSDYAMLGAILVHPKGQTYFVKMIGPESVVKANREPFLEMIKSLK